MFVKYLGIDVQAIYMTMLGLVALYLIVKNAGPLNSIIRSIAGTGERSLVILQGRSPRRVL
jgi:hypothetical protein